MWKQKVAVPKPYCEHDLAYSQAIMMADCLQSCTICSYHVVVIDIVKLVWWLIVCSLWFDNENRTKHKYVLTSWLIHLHQVVQECSITMNAMASQIISLTIVYSTIYSGSDQRKYQSSASLAFVRGIHRWPVNSPHKGPVTRKVLPLDDVIMSTCCIQTVTLEESA